MLVQMDAYLVDHNGLSKRPMNLAMFLFALEHVARICRILRQPGAHALLVGVGGSGRQSLARLAAFVNGMNVFQARLSALPCPPASPSSQPLHAAIGTAGVQVEISKNYGRTEWREDLKMMLRKAGVEGVRCMFLFADTQIKDEAFVEDINNILNAGEVPNMFPSDERMQVRHKPRGLPTHRLMHSHMYRLACRHSSPRRLSCKLLKGHSGAATRCFSSPGCCCAPALGCISMACSCV
jgi:dynein heavy chain, axonemal